MFIILNIMVLSDVFFSVVRQKRASQCLLLKANSRAIAKLMLIFLTST